MGYTTLTSAFGPNGAAGFPTFTVNDLTQLLAVPYGGLGNLPGLSSFDPVAGTGPTGYLQVGDEFIHTFGNLGFAADGRLIITYDQRGLAGSDASRHEIGTAVQNVPQTFVPGPITTNAPLPITVNAGDVQPNAVYVDTRKRNEQWDVCVRCGRPRPMSGLTQQKGILLCYKTCWDNLEIERRQREIQMVLSTNMTPQPEGSDRRVIDRGFFIIDVETG